ncbi:MAG: alpha/beta fold hydrolase [Candidatus Heimdallarchaeota archaeon]|nr:MAG: alpha/beta fold hydrolase [Candidatus Heimdallarchaeota archaeon]
MHIVYLYGFASGPQSNKAQFFKRKFAFSNVPFDIFDYIPDKESFTSMRLSILTNNLHEYIEMEHSGEKELILFGSSFGCLVSAWYTYLHPDKIKKMIFMAPALGFSARRIVKLFEIPLNLWKNRGNVPVFHYRYNQEIPLAYSFYNDLLSNPPPEISKMRIHVPTLIFHGKFDDVVPLSWSQQFIEINPEASLHILNGDHQLLNQKEDMWKIVKDFLNRD